MVMWVLLGLSVGAWSFTYGRWATVQRLWYSVGSKKFLKQPNLDVGAVFLLFCANLVVVSLLVYRQSEAEQSQPAPTERIEPRLASPEEPAAPTDGNPVAEKEPAAPATSPAADHAATASTKDVEPLGNAPTPTPTQTPFQLALTWLLGALVVGTMVFTSRWLYGTTWSSWGCGPLLEGKWRPTFVASVLGFCLLIPPVLLLHEILSLWVTYEHATINNLSRLRAAGDWSAVAVIFLYTAVWTPLVEELMFRVVVQGYAEQFLTHRHNFLRWVLGPLQPGPATVFGVEQAALVANQNPAKSTLKLGFGTWQFWAPIVISGLLFSLAHAGQGAAPIPLYVMAIGLGFLYKTTGNIWLCILIHAYLNGLTLTRLLFLPVDTIG